MKRRRSVYKSKRERELELELEILKQKEQSEEKKREQEANDFEINLRLALLQSVINYEKERRKPINKVKRSVGRFFNSLNPFSF